MAISETLNPLKLNVSNRLVLPLFILLLIVSSVLSGGCMKLTLFTVGITAIFSISAQAQDEPTETYSQIHFEAQNRCIVRMSDSISSEDVEGRVKGLLKAVNASAAYIYKHSVKGFTVNLPCTKAKAAFIGSSDVVSFEPDGLMFALPKPPGRGNGGGDATPEPQALPWGVTRVGGVADGSALTAWIIDTGIDLDNPDLNVDQTYGFSAFTSGKERSPNDGNGHGTHVAGTVAALDNSIDVVGVAAGAAVVPVKVLNRQGSGSYSGVIAGIDHVAAYASAGDCANLSLGGGYSQAVNDAVIRLGEKGVYVAVAAGNESQHAENVSPASANGLNVWTISATDINDEFAYFSNFGNPPVDYAAPGYSVLSLKVGGGTSIKSGTSMAAPHACAVLMLTSGSPSVVGHAIGDPDGTADIILGH